MKNTKMFFALILSVFAFSGLLGMEEDGFYDSGSESDGHPTLERVVPDGNGGFVLPEELPVNPAEIATAKEIIEEKLQRSKSIKTKLESSVDVNGDDLLDFLVEKAGNYIKKHPDLFTNLSASVLEKGVLKTICLSILPTLTANAGQILQNAPTLLQDIRNNPKEWAYGLLKVGGVAVTGWVLWYSGMVGEGNISTIYNMFLDPINGTAVEL